MQLLSHDFIRKYETTEVDLAAFVQNVFDPIQRLKDLADVITYIFQNHNFGSDQKIGRTRGLNRGFAFLQMLTMHYYVMFDGPERTWPHMRTMYRENSALT